MHTHGVKCRRVCLRREALAAIRGHEHVCFCFLNTPTLPKANALIVYPLHPSNSVTHPSLTITKPASISSSISLSFSYTFSPSSSSSLPPSDHKRYYKHTINNIKTKSTVKCFLAKKKKKGKVVFALHAMIMTHHLQLQPTSRHVARHS